tara:strand:- start:671 stop:2350 length:1680 start_codon:yes stop_codon:yes gene_type:complete
MLLRPYQEIAVNSAIDALDKHGNTVVVAPTGAGKTIMLSALIGKRCQTRRNVLVLQHRDELVNQNMDKFKRINPNILTSIVNAEEKDWNGDAVFSMVQTLSRPNNLDNMKAMDMLVVDESHHVVADTYTRIINHAKQINDKVEIVGFTATPNRGDKKGLREVFTNCSHQIEISTLIREGFLVSPKTYVIDVGVRSELENVRKTVVDFDMDQVARIMNKRAINQRVVSEWLDKANDRKTVVFCSTVAHAEDLCQEFVEEGINAKIVTGNTDKTERREILEDLSSGDTQVVVNVSVLTEGFDSPPVSCIVLTRPCSYKSTMVQMIGRGLRTIDQNEYPDIVKTDCVVLDFGTSVLTHGSLEEEVNLEGSQSELQGDAPEKVCPECNSVVPLGVRECPMCGFEFGKNDNSQLEEFTMTEIDLIDRSPFRWLDIFGTGKCVAATGFNGFAMVIDVGDLSCGLIKRSGGKIRMISIGTRKQAIASADDFLREIEDGNSAEKGRRWLNERMSDKQREMLGRSGVVVSGFDFSWTKYKAACYLNYLWNKGRVDDMVSNVREKHEKR